MTFSINVSKVAGLGIIAGVVGLGVWAIKKVHDKHKEERAAVEAEKKAKIGDRDLEKEAFDAMDEDCNDRMDRDTQVKVVSVIRKKIQIINNTTKMDDFNEKLTDFDTFVKLLKTEDCFKKFADIQKEIDKYEKQPVNSSKTSVSYDSDIEMVKIITNTIKYIIDKITFYGYKFV